VLNSNDLSVLLGQLDTCGKGFVEEFDGVEGLFRGHRLLGTIGDGFEDVRSLLDGGSGKAALLGVGLEFVQGVHANSAGVSWDHSYLRVSATLTPERAFAACACLEGVAAFGGDTFETEGHITAT